MSNTFKASETLRQMALTSPKLSWLGGIAETVARLEEDNARMSRDIEAYKGAGERYEQEIARKDDAIAEQSRQLKEALAELEQTTRERDAAIQQLSGHCWCCKIGVRTKFGKGNLYECKYVGGRAGIRAVCPHWEWDFPCAENGGTEDGI